eukprot:CAMPEP_0180576680 /NCGR_PEP_ID=MMETSP1037_2-20121125/11546_1 /TAXON_ID=632150 /ORGANISM="Azadinium spinosum, Strain 3D9" /LENGTH=630 /DNA_ID=CAMNT_0022594409 /DNA_START=51 /DNA_END=1940 /DNA_ORIENTATION=-
MAPPPALAGNIPGLPNSSIANLPSRGVAVFKDGHIDPDTTTIEFCEHFKQALEPYAAGELFFENIDVSGCQWSALGFSVLFDILKEQSVATQRLKAFRCGLEDGSIAEMTEWLKGQTPEALPKELHLSHNKITSEGFRQLLDVLEAKRSELSVMEVPIWLRVEGNPIDAGLVNGLMQKGRICQAAKVGDPARMTCRTAVAAMPWFQPGKGAPPVAIPGKGGFVGKGGFLGKGGLAGKGGPIGSGKVVPPTMPASKEVQANKGVQANKEDEEDDVDDGWGTWQAASSSSKPAATWEKKDWEKKDWEKKDWEKKEWEKKECEKKEREKRDREKKDWERKDWEKKDWEKKDWEKQDWEKKDWEKKDWEKKDGHNKEWEKKDWEKKDDKKWWEKGDDKWEKPKDSRWGENGKSWEEKDGSWKKGDTSSTWQEAKRKGDEDGSWKNDNSSAWPEAKRQKGNLWQAAAPRVAGGGLLTEEEALEAEPAPFTPPEIKAQEEPQPEVEEPSYEAADPEPMDWAATTPQAEEPIYEAADPAPIDWAPTTPQVVAPLSAKAPPAAWAQAQAVSSGRSTGFAGMTRAQPQQPQQIAEERDRSPPGEEEPAEPVVPPGWEKLHSEEYGIPYYFCKESGESVW